jgi:NAD(P)H-flavin reductase
VIDAAWKHGLWSVEVKQPQLQVARDYTPLPPAAEGGDEAGMMRLLIRRMERGEVSGYLAGLGVGDEVEIRGPRLGFDVRERVGVAPATNDGEGGGAERKKVVFLAGGTGIAPALQAARALFMKGKEAGKVEMEVVWANRRREDCEQGVVVGMLEEMRRRSGGRFSYVCTVDEEGSFIDAGTITQATGVSTSAGGRSSWWWPFGSTSNSGVAASEHTVVSDACRYHSAKKLVVSDDRDDEDSAGTGKHCRCEDGNGKRVAGSKNLLMVSGPDGFIERFTGAKVWGGGKELQGPVKGVVGELRRQYPSLGDDWLVLKM